MANQTLILNVSDEMKLEDDRELLCEELSAEELCSSSLDTTEELYSSSVPDTCGEGNINRTNFERTEQWHKRFTGSFGCKCWNKFGILYGV